VFPKDHIVRRVFMLLLFRLTKISSSLISLAMPVTRSRSKAAVARADKQLVPKPPKSGRKRGVAPDEVADPVVEGQQLSKKARFGKQPVPSTDAQPVGTVVVPDDLGPRPALVPAELSFSFEGAKQHLAAADTRFQDVFATAICTPYQKLDRVEPFR